ncbi:MAG TPA: type II toxin-antitoxin system VapC family toxin [Bryobacteraceae bacterium]|nr:type II toxin-antitoxin system VapC family toxin [Bryobacteraceae bacterium]
MIAVDTNVLIRLLMQDEMKQGAAAKSLFASQPIWIARTVLLEANWVLRSLYGFSESAIVEAFTNLLGLPNVHTEDKPAMATAFAISAAGVELADAIHLTSRPPGAKFVSFDRSFVRRAQRPGVSEISVVETRH